MQLVIRLKETAHFGACPECHEQENLILNVGKVHWAVCEEHGVCWYLGSNLFGRCGQSETDWERNAEFLNGLRHVQPAHWAYSDWTYSD